MLCKRQLRFRLLHATRQQLPCWLEVSGHQAVNTYTHAACDSSSHPVVSTTACALHLTLPLPCPYPAAHLLVDYRQKVQVVALRVRARLIMHGRDQNKLAARAPLTPQQRRS